MEEYLIKKDELYEWRLKYRKVKFCYACRQLKSIDGGFYSWKDGSRLKGKNKTKVGNVCKSCRLIRAKKQYRLINN